MAKKNRLQLSFPNAAERWFELTRAEISSEEEGETLEALDQRLLRHRPTSDLETIVLMDVVTEAMRGGGRTDGLDVAALLNIRDRVLQFSTQVGLGESYAALQRRAYEDWDDTRLAATG